MAHCHFPDCRVGDGDCGTTLRKGAETICSDLTSRWGCQCMTMLRLTEALRSRQGHSYIPEVTLVVWQTTVTSAMTATDRQNSPF